ncbi:MAG: hypothetical protein AAF415_06825 [Pseudomonadota bacterium]
MAAELTLAGIGLDLARIVHLFAMAVAVGTVAFTDFSMLRRLQVPIRHGWIGFLTMTHQFVVWVMVVIWVSGLCLIWLRTDFQVEAFTPKLWAKLTVVNILLLTAVGIKRFVVPRIIEGAGGTMLDLPWRAKRAIAIFAGLSVAGWSSALILGGSDLLKPVGPGILSLIFGAVYLTTVSAALAMAWRAHLIYSSTLPGIDHRISSRY